MILRKKRLGKMHDDYQVFIINLNQNNYAEYNGNILKLKVNKSTKDNKSYYIQFSMRDFNQLKIYNWYKYLSFALYDYNNMVGHIHNIDLLNNIVKDSIKLDNLYIVI